MGFVLEFFFSPNEYFENSVLTKTYDMKCVPDEEDPFSFEGPEIHKCKVVYSNDYCYYRNKNNFVHSCIIGHSYRVEEGKECYRQNHQKEAETQVQRICAYSFQDCSEWFVLQLLQSSNWWLSFLYKMENICCLVTQITWYSFGWSRSWCWWRHARASDCRFWNWPLHSWKHYSTSYSLLHRFQFHFIF